MSAPNQDRRNLPEFPSIVQVETAELAAIDWMSRNASDSGRFLYAYDAQTDTYAPEENELRQLMSFRLVASLSKTDSRFAKIHEDNLRYLFSRWYHDDTSRAYVDVNGVAKLGASAMALRTIVESPHSASYVDVARKLALGILSAVEPSGDFRAFITNAPAGEDAAYLLTFYSGEALLALLEYAQRFGDSIVIQRALRTQDRYVELYVENIDANYSPTYVPWHTLSLSLAYAITGDRTYADAAFTITDRLLELIDTTEHLGRFYSEQFAEYGGPHSASDGVYTEGVAVALRLALSLGETERERRYRRALGYALMNLMRLQFVDGDEKDSVRAQRSLGSLRVRSGSRETRLDCSQHAIDAFRASRHALTYQNP